MNLYFRLLLAFIQSRLTSRLRIQETGRREFVVLPTDIDLYGHMNNGRYFQVMDVARFSWLLRTGIVTVLRKNRWSALLGGGKIQFRRALSLFQRYTVSTRLLCWDERWYYLHHRFEDRAGRLVADGVVRAAFHSGKGWVRTADAMPQIDASAINAPMPAMVRDWLQSESTDIPMKLVG